MSQSIVMSNLAHSGGNFLEETYSIDQTIMEANTNVQRIRELQERIISSTSIQQESSYMEERDALAASTKTLYTKVKDRINHLSKMKSTEVDDVRINQFQRLREKFTKSLQEYQNVAEAFMASQKDRITRQYRVVNPNATQQEIDNYVSDSSNRPIFQQSLLRTGEARAAAVEVEKRHNDIKQIEQTIAELVDLTRQLDLQVGSQDETILHVVGNVEGATTKLQNATEDLNQAQKHGVSARRKKWICLGISVAVIAIIIIILIIYLRPKN